MQREIEFRGYSTALRKWVYGYLIFESDKSIIVNDDQYIFVKPETVGQYTGLNDKKDKKVYEGDECIVNKPCVTARGYIKYIKGCHVFKEFRTNTFISLCDLNINGYTIEVIGNIHDNKELLEVESHG